MRVVAAVMAVLPDLLVEPGVGHASLVAGEAVEPLERVGRQGDAALLVGEWLARLIRWRIGKLADVTALHAPVERDAVRAADDDQYRSLMSLQGLADLAAHECLAAAVGQTAGTVEQPHVAAQFMAALQVRLDAQRGVD